MSDPVLRFGDGGTVYFHCPGCNEQHMIQYDLGSGPRWLFNASLTHPTFEPSIKVSGVQRMTDAEYEHVMRGGKVEPRPCCCHSFIRDGQIEFLSDCTHSLAGQTVALHPISQSK